MTDTAFDPEAVVDAMAPLLGLRLTPESRAQTALHLRDRRGAGEALARGRDRRRGRAGAGVHRMTELIDRSALEIAAAVKSGEVSAREVAEAALARIEKRNPALGAFTDVTAERALRESRVDRRRALARRDARAARGRALRGEEPVRRRGPPDAGRLEDQSRPPARDGRRDARLAHGGGRRSPALARSTWANTPMTSPARIRMTAPSRNPHDLEHMSGGLFRRLGRRGRGRSGADCARLRHERIDPRAELLLRAVRPEADLRPLVAGAHVSLCREPRSSRALRPQRRRSGRVLRRDARARTRTIRRRPTVRRTPASPSLEEGAFGLRIAVARRLFRALGRGLRLRGGRSRRPRAQSQARGRTRRGGASARGRLSHHDGRGRRAPSRPPARARRRLRSRRARPPDRGRDAARRLGRRKRKNFVASTASRRSSSFVKSTSCSPRRRRSGRRSSDRKP